MAFSTFAFSALDSTPVYDVGSANVIEQMSRDMAGMTYAAPWTMIGLVAAIAYAASLLTTYLPARQASKVYPAEALHYE